MGACVSRPESCVRRRNQPDGSRKRRRRRGIKRPASARRTMETIDEMNGADHPPLAHPAAHGSIEEAWFDSITMPESDCDEDFESAHDDALSLNGFEGASIRSVSSLKDGNHEEINTNAPSSSVDNNMKGTKPADQSNAKPYVNLDDVCNLSADGTSGKEEGGALDHCGILPNNCLPCLTPTTPPLEKRRSLSSSPPNTKKKASLKLSMRRRTGEGHALSASFSTKIILERPLAGSQVLFCPSDKKILNRWSNIDPNTFRVRAENYFRDKKKESAANYAAYYPFGVDVYLSQQKIAHIGRFVQLPDVKSSSKLPSILIVNVQIPLYPTAIFQNETDGEGMNFVLYFELSESYLKELPSNFQENIRG